MSKPKPEPMPTGCQHPPVAGLTGNIVSPRVHYGDGLDGLVECILCRKMWKPKEGEI